MKSPAGDKGLLKQNMHSDLYTLSELLAILTELANSCAAFKTISDAIVPIACICKTRIPTSILDNRLL